MRAVVQRVSKASCLVNKEIVGQIASGYLILLGIGQEDTTEIADKLVTKITSLRINSDKSDKMNLSIKDINGQVLVISQFTLYGNTKKGNRPSFVTAAKPEEAQKLYEYFIAKIKESGIKVESGRFGTKMDIPVELDGPVTIIIDA